MCKYCNQIPCPVSCPGYEDEPLTYCGCGRPIYAGDTYYEICDTIYCEDCVSDCRRTAEKYDFEG